MAFIEFGWAKRRKEALERIQTAIMAAQAEYDTVPHTLGVARALKSSAADVSTDVQAAHVRSFAYLSITLENAMEGMGKKPFWNIRPYYPPLDPHDLEIDKFFSSVASHLYGGVAVEAAAPRNDFEREATTACRRS